MKPKAKAVIISFLLLALVIGACNNAAKKPGNPEQNVPQTENLDISASERRVMANQLSKAAEGVAGVQRASVVIANMENSDLSKGNNLAAMVGLTVSSSISADQAKIDATKNMVVDRIKKANNRVSQVLVTTDPTMIKRINDIAAGIIEGKPLQTFEKDIHTLNDDLKKQKFSNNS